MAISAAYLKKMVDAGRLGMKSGAGFYDYSPAAQGRPCRALLQVYTRLQATAGPDRFAVAMIRFPIRVD